MFAHGTTVMHYNLLIISGGCGLFFVLFILAIIDFRKYILPDIFTLPLIIFGIGFSYIQGAFIPSIIGALIGYCGFRFVEISYKKARGLDGLGQGDAKLLAAGGAWCGWFGLPFIVLIASASGLAHAFLLSRDKESRAHILPFGPHLSLGIFIVWIALNFL